MNTHILHRVSLACSLTIGLLALPSKLGAQLSIQGRIESRISSVSASIGTTTTVSYAATPPGYLGAGSVNQAGAGVFSTGLTLLAATGGGSATLAYQPTDGAANPTNEFSALSGGTFELGRLSLSSTALSGSGSVNFTWTTEFAELQVFDGATPVSELFTHVEILTTPMTLSLSSLGNEAVLAIVPPETETYFTTSVDLGDYRVQLWPETSLWTVLGDLNSAAAFASLPDWTAVTDGTDIMVSITPVPEASTYAIGAMVLLMGVIGWRRRIWVR